MITAHLSKVNNDSLPSHTSRSLLTGGYPKCLDFSFPYILDKKGIDKRRTGSVHTARFDT
jgi:hypothetical protein